MKKNVWLIAAVVLASAALLVSLGTLTGSVVGKQRLQAGGAPGVVSYQGQVFNSGQPYDDTGYFKFAIVNAGGTTSYWSNDGTSSAGGEPTSSISIVVDQGLFSVLLGDTDLGGMSMALDETSFSDPDTYLRVWFSDDDATFIQLADQKIAAVPYALQAQVALDADALGGVDATGYQLEVTGNCPVGYAVREVNGDGSVICEAVQGRPGFSITTYGDDSDSYAEHSSIAIGVDGLGLISYGVDPTDDLAVGHCHDLACTSMTSTIVGSGKNYNSITIGSDGYGLIAHKGTSVLVTHCNNIACTSADTYVVATGSNTGHYIDITTGSDGYGLIAFADYSSTWAVKVAHCTNVACSSSVVSIVDSATSAVGRTLSMAIGADGLGLISYSDYSAENLFVAHCNDIACSTNSHTAIDTPGNVGAFSSITIGVDGLGLIAYDGGSVLKVAHCQNIICNAADTAVLDSSIRPGGTAITIGKDGLGLIAYTPYSGTGVIKVAHCKDTICTTADILTLDSGTSPTGRFGLTIGSDGLPLLVYSFYNGVTRDMKVAHCSNRFCVPYNRSW